MKKKSSPSNRKSVVTGVIILAVVTITGLGVVAAVATKQSELAPNGQTSVVNLKGKATCLPKKNPGEVQTMECASGLRVSDGTYYALVGTDTAGSEETVTVTGTLSPPNGDELYDIAGTINVTSMKP